MSLPFTGIRILDLSRVWSGPLATRILADLGAEVIKIEAPGSRAIIPESTVFYFNRNKLSVSLNLNPPAGRALFKKLVAVSDVVLENFSPRVMANFGLDYSALRQVKPDIVMISMPGFGMDGPYRNILAYGTTLEPQAGMSSLMGYPDAGPYKSGNAYPDPVAALNATTALLVALWHRRQTGQGQYIDLSQLESATVLIGEYIAGYGMSGELPESPGNRHPSMAPHGCYPCRGEDNWAVIAVASDEEWRALCQAMGRPELAADERFANGSDRWQHQDLLDAVISGWTRALDNRQVMNLLQEAGVAAGAVLNAAGMADDPHLKERDHFWEIPHPEWGSFPFPGLPIRFSTIQPGLRLNPPLLGEHNEPVLVDLLGLTQQEVERLEKDGVL